MEPTAIIGALVGVIGTLTTVIAYFWRLHQADDAERKVATAAELARVVADRDRREAVLVGERDDWRDRANAHEQRMDRFSRAFERLAGGPAPE